MSLNLLSFLSISFFLCLSLSLAFISFLDCAAFILVPQSGIEPWPSAVRLLSPNHWATREFPCLLFLDWLFTLPTKQHTLCESWWGEGVQSSNLHLWSVDYFPIFSKCVSLNSMSYGATSLWVCSRHSHPAPAQKTLQLLSQTSLVWEQCLRQFPLSQ